jgi:hypothetical protein
LKKNHNIPFEFRRQIRSLIPIRNTLYHLQGDNLPTQDTAYPRSSEEIHVDHRC